MGAKGETRPAVPAYILFRWPPPDENSSNCQQTWRRASNGSTRSRVVSIPQSLARWTSPLLPATARRHESTARQTCRHRDDPPRHDLWGKSGMTYEEGRNGARGRQRHAATACCLRRGGSESRGPIVSAGGPVLMGKSRSYSLYFIDL